MPARHSGKVDKGWGYELIWATNDSYCGKILVFEKPGSKMSMHFHKEKDEQLKLFLKNKKIQRTVFKYMLRGRKRNAGSRIQPGLTRPKMLEFLTELDSKQDLGDQADKSLPRATASAS